MCIRDRSCLSTPAAYSESLARWAYAHIVTCTDILLSSLSLSLSLYLSLSGIEWVSQTSFATYAYTTPNASGNVRNEIAITDLQAGQSPFIMSQLCMSIGSVGRVTHLRRPDESEGSYQSPIDTIKISLHKYVH